MKPNIMDVNKDVLKILAEDTQNGQVVTRDLPSKATTDGIESKILGFIKGKKVAPNDTEIHSFADKEGIEHSAFEGEIYKLLFKMAHGQHLKHAMDPDSDFDSNELEMGIKVEQEHLDDPEVAKAIAKAHLSEFPDYYTRLAKMEKDAKDSIKAVKEERELTEVLEPGIRTKLQKIKALAKKLDVYPKDLKDLDGIVRDLNDNPKDKDARHDLEQLLGNLDDEQNYEDFPEENRKDMENMINLIQDLSDELESNEDEDDGEEDDYEAVVDGHRYSNPKVVKFVKDMERAGYEMEHYKGRFYWEGPAVRTSGKRGPSLQDVMHATRVKLQYDNMGLDHIVYPVVSDAGKKD